MLVTLRGLKVKGDQHLLFPCNITCTYNSNITVMRIKDMIAKYRKSSLLIKSSVSVPYKMFTG